MYSFKGIMLPSLPALPSIFKDVNSNNNSNDCSNELEEDNLSPVFENKTKEDSSSDDESIINKRFIDFENYEDYKRYNVIKTGENLQRLIYTNYCKGKELTSKKQNKIRSECVAFVSMFINDYHPDMYNYIVSILLDCKAMAKDFGYQEEKELILKGLKMIQHKALTSDIPAGGAGGPEYWVGYE